MSTAQEIPVRMNHSVPLNPTPQLPAIQTPQAIQQQMMAAMPDMAFVSGLLQQTMNLMATAPTTVEFARQDGQRFKDEITVRFEVEE